MIDAHCHLEQKDYDKDRDELVAECRKEMKAIVTSCGKPEDFDLTFQIAQKHKDFVFAIASIHPVYIKEVTEAQQKQFFELVRKNRDKLVGIGETGFDYEIEEPEFREKQKQLFIKFINLAKELKLPLVVHARAAFEETVDVLEEQKAKDVLMHFFTAKKLLDRIIANDWHISVNTTLLMSKGIKKIVRDMPLQRILTETDAPWLGQGQRNTPLSVKAVIEKIAEIKKLSFAEVDKATTENAIRFFNLKI